ncbi:DUF6292 family protein [Actinophytocola sediminis]
MELDPRSQTARALHRYTGLVSVALGQAGDAFWVHTESPATGYIPLADRAPAFPNRDLALLWDERHGWSAAIETASGEDLIVVSYLGRDILPPPSVVARFAAALIAGKGPGVPEPPAFREVDDLDDLADRIAEYTPAPDHQLT